MAFTATHVDLAMEQLRFAIGRDLTPYLARISDGKIKPHAGPMKRLKGRNGDLPRQEQLFTFADTHWSGRARLSLAVDGDSLKGLAMQVWFTGYGVQEGLALEVRGITDMLTSADHARIAINQVVSMISTQGY